MPNPNDDDDNEEPSFTVPNFARDEAEGRRESQAPRTDGRYLRGLAFRLSELLVKGSRAEFEIGALIDEVATNHHWQEWPGARFPKFADWSWTILGYRGRKAEYLRRNWQALSAMHLSEVALTSALRVGWSKLKEILRVARDEVTLFQWIDRVNEMRWTEKQLRAAVIEAGASQRGPTAAGDPDDAGRDPAERRHGFSVVFEDEDSYRTVMQACNIISQRYDSEMGNGRCLALMATSYIATTPRADEGGAAVELEYILKNVESHYGVKLVVAAGEGEDEADTGAGEDEDEGRAPTSRDTTALDI